MNQFQDSVQQQEFGDGTPNKPGFYALKGGDAVSAYKGTTDSILQQRQQIEDSLPNNYMKQAFGTASRRLTQFTLSNLGRHYDQQLDTHNVATQTASINLALQGAGASWNNDDAYNNLFADATRAQALRDRAAGASPEVAQWNQANLESKFLTARVEGAIPYDTTTASNLLEQSKGKIPAAEYARLFSTIQTKSNTLAATHGANTFVTNMDSLWGNTPQNETPVQGGPPQAAPPQAAPHPNNIGNVKASENTFAAPATPTDGVTLAANTLRKGYQDMTLQQIGQKWVGRNQPQQEIDNWIANVSRTSGVPADAVPDLDNPVQLAALVKGIGVAEKSPADRQNFTDQVINDGVRASLGGAQSQTGNGSEGFNLAPEQVLARNQQFVKTGTTDYYTHLSPQEETAFRSWLGQHKEVEFNPDEKTPDYDMRGFWQALQSGDPRAKQGIDPNDGKVHEPDYWKTPYDLTFSRQSKFANENAPEWNDKDQLVLPNGSVVFDDKAHRYYPVGAQALQQPTYQTKADFYEQNAGAINDHLQAYAQAQAPDNPMVQDKIIRDVQEHMRTTIQAQNTQIAQDGNTVQRWANGDFSQGQKPTAMEQMPQNVRDAYQRWEQRKPEQARALDNVLKANAKTDTGYGAGFDHLLTQVYTQQITDPAKLMQFVGDETGNGISSAGLQRLQKEMQTANSPQGSAEAMMKKRFFDAARSEISGTTAVTHDPEGDKDFEKFLSAALPAYDDERAKGTPIADIFNPKGTHYLGNLVDGFVGKDATRVSRMNIAASRYAQTYSDLTNPQAMGNYLKGEIAGQRMTREQAVQVLLRQFPQLAQPNAQAAAPAAAGGG